MEERSYYSGFDWLKNRRYLSGFDWWNNRTYLSGFIIDGRIEDNIGCVDWLKNRKYSGFEVKIIWKLQTRAILWLKPPISCDIYYLYKNIEIFFFLNMEYNLVHKEFHYHIRVHFWCRKFFYSIVKEKHDPYCIICKYYKQPSVLGPPCFRLHRWSLLK